VRRGEGQGETCKEVTQGGRCKGCAVLQERRTRGDDCAGA
jgi:hypothetical protein